MRRREIDVSSAGARSAPRIRWIAVVPVALSLLVAVGWGIVSVKGGGRRALWSPALSTTAEGTASRPADPVVPSDADAVGVPQGGDPANHELETMYLGYPARLQDGPYTCTRFDVIAHKRYAYVECPWPGWGFANEDVVPFGPIRLGGDGILECVGWADPGDLLPAFACRVNHVTSWRPQLDCEEVGEVLHSLADSRGCRPEHMIVSRVVHVP